jgi:small subunit ribosomal protein S4e
MTAPKWWPIDRKNTRFTFAPRGAYKRELSLPLLLFIRTCSSSRRTEGGLGVIKKGEVLVDGRKRKDPNFGVGPFCMIEIPSAKKTWRAIPKDGLSFIEVPDKESNLKLCKIVDKNTVRGGKTQLNLSDGRNMLTEEKYATNDSLLIQVPEQKVVDHIKFAESSTCMVFRGKSAG